MKKPADVIEARPEWLSRAIVLVMKLPAELPLRGGVERHTLQLLRSIEADRIPVPSVWSIKGCIVLQWGYGNRAVAVTVDGPGSYLIRRTVSNRADPRRRVRVARVRELRWAVAWLYPAANQSTVMDLAGWGT